jgi:hypothetical protein
METVLRELVLRRELAPARRASEAVKRRAITETPQRDAEVIVAASSSVPGSLGASAASGSAPATAGREAEVLVV